MELVKVVDPRSTLPQNRTHGEFLPGGSVPAEARTAFRAPLNDSEIGNRATDGAPFVFVDEGAVAT
jgi:hypothetical protein